MKNKITTIAFDADDTLWVNEPYFQEVERQFCALFADSLAQDAVSQELFKTEMKNLHLYGYGAKGFILCMLETASRLAQAGAGATHMDSIIAMGHELLQKPIELLPGVVETLTQLQPQYRLIVATKGDLLDQERKLQKSGLTAYFHHIEIMSDKKISDYQKLLQHLDCKADNFLMVGNSIKSDILPILELGGYAAHIPFHITWSHEQHKEKVHHQHFMELTRLDQLVHQLI